MQQESSQLEGNVAGRVVAVSKWKPPVKQEAARVTQKVLGLYVTPEDSPVQPERFTGYHTGTDYELLPGEEARDVVVSAACDGEVVHKGWVTGYGGVLVQECSAYGEKFTVLYGHLRLASVKTRVGRVLHTGNRIGVLGAAYTNETDGERAHLHFAVHRGEEIDFRGYVQKEEELDGWIDVVELW